jgi:aspartyl-tRNA synthetase
VSSLKPEKKEQLLELLDAKAGDLILFALGEQSTANQILGRLRLFIAQKLEVIDTVSLSNQELLCLCSQHILCMLSCILMRYQ